MQNVYLGGKQIGRVYIGNQSISNVRNLPEDFTIEYVVVAGGGGGAAPGAGGGAGGVTSGSATFTKHYSSTNTLSAVIGAGGPATTGSAFNQTGSNGQNSTLGGIGAFNIVAIGGGGGASVPYNVATLPYATGSTGGSGGGGGATIGSRGLGTPGQGFDGGIGYGGGGGCAGTGSNGTGPGGNGGPGTVIWWNKYNSGRVADGGGGSSTSQNSGSGGPTGGDGGGYPPSGPLLPYDVNGKSAKGQYSGAGGGAGSVGEQAGTNLGGPGGGGNGNNNGGGNGTANTGVGIVTGKQIGRAHV